jgi:AMP nucleosidase
MDHTAFLARHTGRPTPGRLAVRAVPATELDIEEKKKERSHQATVLVDYMILLHKISCAAICDAYQGIRDREKAARSEGANWFASNRELSNEIFPKIKNGCYPYIFVSRESIVKVNEKMRWRQEHGGEHRDMDASYAFDMILAPVDHYQTITEPGMQRDYLTNSINQMLLVGYEVEVGLSIVPIPLLFALERNGFLETPQGRMAEVAQAHFPIPNLAEIEDSFADGTYKRRNASSLANVEYQLFHSEFWIRYRRYLEKPTNNEGWLSISIDTEEFREFAKSNFDGKKISEPRFPSRCDGMPPVERVPHAVPKRFGLFDALRTDFSIARLRHYTGTSPEHFQKYVLFTNYARYVRRFIHRCIVEIYRCEHGESPKLIVPPKAKEHDVKGFEYSRDNILEHLTQEDLDKICAAIETSEPSAIDENLHRKIELGFVRSDSQMPAYHFIPSVKSQSTTPRQAIAGEYPGRILREQPIPGVTLVNIGVGPSNARNITDHIAVLRPLCWIMVGHCGGLRQRQKLGDYVIANGYVRRDGVLDAEVPLDLPLHGTRVVNEALSVAAAHHLAKSNNSGDDLLSIMTALNVDPNDKKRKEEINKIVQLRSHARAGTVLTTANRNWETSPTDEMFELVQRYRVVAVDMESATLATNASRYRVPHGTFLCISDRPLHGVIKMKLNSDKFYADQISKHLDISLDTLKLLHDNIDLELGLQYPRELTGTDDPPWR